MSQVIISKGVFLQLIDALTIILGQSIAAGEIEQYYFSCQSDDENRPVLFIKGPTGTRHVELLINTDGCVEIWYQEADGDGGRSEFHHQSAVITIASGIDRYMKYGRHP